MEQVKALNALEQFLALSKSATSPRAAADLITRATSNPNTFLFTELLQTPQVQALSSSEEFAPYLTLLQIFSYGTYGSYKSTENLPALNDAQILKLRQLSLLTLAKEKSNLTYAALTHSLGLRDTRELEDIVISAIYGGLISATLDPSHKVVEVSSVAPLRDLAPGSIPSLLTTLKAWSGRCDSTLAELEARIALIRKTSAQKASDKRTWDSQIAKAVEDEKAGGGEGGGAAGKKPMTLQTGHGHVGQRPARFGKRGSNLMAPDAADDEAMDVDDEDEEADGKKRASRRKL